jgi:hypothetical protein
MYTSTVRVLLSPSSLQISSVAHFRNLGYETERGVLDPTVPNTNLSISGFDPAARVLRNSG